MQKITKIDLNSEQISYPAVGYQGEANKRQLRIIPPRDLDAAAYFLLAFDLAGGVFRPSVKLVPPINVKLSPPVTNQRQVQMTLEGFAADGTVLGSPRWSFCTSKKQ